VAVNTRTSFEHALERATSGESLTDNEVACLLATPPGEPLERLFAAAQVMKERAFGDQIFLYGFVYFSTYCQNHCQFCMYRYGNEEAPRYRKSIEAIMDVARALEDDGVHLIDLTMGEDPWYLQQNGEMLIELVVRFREAVDLPIMLSPGVLSSQLLVEIANKGVDWYACYQETFNKRLFISLRKGQNFIRRLKTKVQAREAGLLIEEGLLLGVGENGDDLVLALRNMEILGASQLRAMTFRPQPGTPMGQWQVPEMLNELRTIAVFRLLFPDRLIPASLDVDGIEGLKSRILAGANVVTSLIPPYHKFAGVSRAWLGIEEGKRAVAAATNIIERLGLRRAPLSMYRQWIQKEKRRVGRQDRMDSKSM
jgi:methylornithine synthase